MIRWSLEEYETLVDELVQSVRAEMLPYTRALYLFGSYAKELDQLGCIIPGISDVDLLWIIDLSGVAHTEDDLLAHYQVIIDLVSQITLNPLYSTLLDLTILENRQLPTRIGMEFDPVLLHAASQGRALVGKPILNDLHFSESYVKRAARSRYYRAYELFHHLYIYNSYQLAELIQDIAITILDMGHSILALKGHFDIVKKEIPDVFQNIIEEEEIPSLGVLDDAIKIRMGMRDVHLKRFIKKAILFSQQTFDFVQSPEIT